MKLGAVPKCSSAAAPNLEAAQSTAINTETIAPHREATSAILFHVFPHVIFFNIRKWSVSVIKAIMFKGLLRPWL